MNAQLRNPQNAPGKKVNSQEEESKLDFRISTLASYLGRFGSWELGVHRELGVEELWR
jgi:hypothetical protein